VIEKTEANSNEITVVDRRDYEHARNHIDKIIADTGAKAQKELRKIAEIRTKIYLNLTDQWLMTYYSAIEGFLDNLLLADAQRKMAQAFRHYARFAFQYRYFEDNARNILFHKIFSFTIYFFHEYNVFPIPSNNGATNPSDPDAELFYLNPLGHLCYFWLQKEYHVTPRNLSQIADKSALYDRLLAEIRNTMLEFFKRHRQNEIGPDSFRHFYQNFSTPEFKGIMQRIEKRGPRELL